VGHQTSVLPQIYEDNVNIAIWQRTHASLLTSRYRPSSRPILATH
jgi:hypothetical protein